jgi:hypothetical protein
MRGAAAAGETREKVDTAAKEAGKALAELRELVAEGTLARKKVEVEKAAGSVVASLVEMEMVSLPSFPSFCALRADPFLCSTSPRSPS